MLQLLIDLGQSGATPQQMLARLQALYGKPRWVGEVVAEYAHLRTGMSLCALDTHDAEVADLVMLMERQDQNQASGHPQWKHA